MTVAILGGGLTGLTLANLLNSENIVMLEKEAECGGLCRSLQEDGYTFDCGGSHVIFSKDRDVLEFMKKMLGNNICQRRRNAKILYKGKLVKYPFENGLSGLSKQDNFQCLLGFIKAHIWHNTLIPANFKEWMYYTFGSGITEKYLLPYNTKIWKFDTAKMGLSWVVGRVPQPPIEDVVKASLGLESEGYLHQLNFYYPREGGIHALIKSMEKKVQKKAEIVNNFNVDYAEKIDNGWLVSDGSNQIKCDEIISTLPLFDIVHALRNVPKVVEEATARLKYNSLITVMLGVDSPNLNDLSWLYIPDKACLSHRVSFPSNYSDKVAPPGKSSLLAEITYNEGDDIDNLTNEAILQNVISYLHRNKIISKYDIVYTRISRTKYAYVINDLNYEKNIGIIKAYLRKAGIHLVGRFSEWEYYNMDACIRNSMDFASGWKMDTDQKIKIATVMAQFNERV